MSSVIESTRVYVRIFMALLILTGITVGAAFVDFGWMNSVIALTIAVIKAALVVLFFMHVRHTNKLNQVFIAAGFLWLIILISFTLSDYFTRNHPKIPQARSWIHQSAS